MAFDPDAYLRSAPKPAPTAFDPDAYLKSKATAESGAITNPFQGPETSQVFPTEAKVAPKLEEPKKERQSPTEFVSQELQKMTPEKEMPTTETGKGIESGKIAVKTIPESLSVVKDVSAAKTNLDLINLYDQIDKGEITDPTKIQADSFIAGRARMYMNSKPEMRNTLRERSVSEVKDRREMLKDSVEMIKQYQQERLKYKGKTEDLTDVKGIQDFTDWAAFNFGSGMVQLVPVMLAAATTGGAGAVVTGTAMELSGGVQTRINKILEDTKDVADPQQRADQIRDYVLKTGDATMAAALASGSLDAFLGPASTLLKQPMKEAAKNLTKREVAKQIPKEAAKQGAEEFVAGGSQEAINIAAERAIGEQTGDVLSEENFKRIVNSAAAESVAGTGVGAGMQASKAIAAPSTVEQAPQRPPSSPAPQDQTVPPPVPPTKEDKAPEGIGEYWRGTASDYGVSLSDIQNRDRSRPASIQQVQSIAGNPDYNRLSVSREFGTGAPVVISDYNLAPQTLGITDVLSASDGSKIPVQYAVVDAASLTPSNFADGSKDPGYSQEQLPLIRPVAGNGRVAGLQKAYQDGTAQGYLQSMIEDSSHGIDPQVIQQMVDPVLIRVMPKSSLVPNIADISNVGGQLGMSPTEQAKIDMGRFDLGGLEFLADGQPTTRSVAGFVAAMPKEEQAALRDSNGQPNKIAEDRLNNAIFAQAYGNDALIGLQTEAKDPEAQTIMRGLAVAAPSMVKLDGVADYDLRDSIIEATEQAINARRQGARLEDYIQQGALVSNPYTMPILQFFANNIRSAKKIGDGLRELGDAAAAQATQSQAGVDMFGENPVLSLDQVFSQWAQNNGLTFQEPAQQAPQDVQEDVQEEAPPATPSKPKKPAKAEVKERHQFDHLTKSKEQIAREVKGKTIVELSKWSIANAPNEFAKAVAKAVHKRIVEMEKRGVPMDFNVLTGSNRLKKAYGVLRGLYSFNGAKYELALNAPSRSQKLGELAGTDYQTILHELLHMATQGSIVKASNLPEIKELQKLYDIVQAQIDADKKAGKRVPVEMLDRGATMKDLHEFISWGLTDEFAQTYLAKIQVSPTQNGFKKFAELIRKLMGLDGKYQTAIESLVSISEEMLARPAVEIAREMEKRGTRFGAPTTSTVNTPSSIVETIESTSQKLGKEFDRFSQGLRDRMDRQFKPESKNIIDKLKGLQDRFFQRLAQGLADQYRTIRDIDYDAYIMARLSKTVDGALEGMMFNGQVYLRDGALDIKPNTDGLIEILSPVGNELDVYQIWVAANRDARLPADKRSVDPEIVAARDELSDGELNGEPRIDVYNRVLKNMNKLNKSVLDIALKQGIIDKTGYDRFSNDIYYIPFYKVMEGEEAKTPMAASGLSGQYFSRELKGGERPFGDLMENTLRNWSHILSASMKNAAAAKTIDSAMMLGVAYPNLKNFTTKDGVEVPIQWRMERDANGDMKGQVVFESNGKPIPAEIDENGNEVYGEGELRPYLTTQKKGMAKVMMNGQPAYFEITDPLLLDSIMSIGYMGPKSKFLDVARGFKNVLQYGVTLSPGFKVRNLFRDSISAIAVSDMKLNPVANVYQGWNLSNKNNPAHISALAGGAIFNFGSAYEGDQSKMIKRLIKKGVAEEDILDTADKIKAGLLKAFDAYNELGNRSESANRMALYQQMIDKGASHLEASFYARDMLDFSMQGSWPAFRLCTQVIPFLNARVQGLYKLGRDGLIPTARLIYNTKTGKPIDATDRQKAVQFSIVMSAVALASMSLYMIFKDDEEFKKREQWDRDNFWWIRIPGMEKALRIPKPFEIGAFGTMAERTLEQILDKDVEGRVFGESVKRMFVDTFAINHPQFYRPLLDLYANKDSFTGAPIETRGMEELSKAQRMTDKTSPLAIGVSRLQNVFVPESLEVSPVQTEYAIKAYFGWLGGTAEFVSHYAMMPFSKGTAPNQDYSEIASMGFVKSLPATQSKYMTSFYQNSKEISQAYADMRHYAEIGEMEKVDKIIAEKGDLIALNKSYDRAAKQMSKVRKAISAIRADEDMSGSDKKEEIDRLKTINNEIAESVERTRVEFARESKADKAAGR
jgi:hypothetical protein